MTLTETKLYLRIDGNDSEIDAEISSLMVASESYIKRMTGKTKVKVGKDIKGLDVIAEITKDALFNQANKLLIAHWYENRGIEIAGNLTKITHSVDALVNHISMCGDYI